MKPLIFLNIFLGLIMFKQVQAATGTFDSRVACRVAEKTMLRPVHSDEEIEMGAVAVGPDGSNIGLKEILSDEMIHFKDSSGKISNAYVWMYSRINRVENRQDKYLSTSYGEDVIITVVTNHDKSEITYVGTSSGKFLTLSCQ